MVQVLSVVAVDTFSVDSVSIVIRSALVYRVSSAIHLFTCATQSSSSELGAAQGAS